MKSLKRGMSEIDRKQWKKKRQFKAARLIVRNLPFKSTENNIKEHFSQFGAVSEVKLLRKGTKLVGCGFVQFETKSNAAAAIQKASGQQFLGRTIIVDWAVPKNRFVKNLSQPVEIKEEFDNKVKNEVISDSESERNIKIKDEEESSSDSSDASDLDEDKDSDSDKEFSDSQEDEDSNSDKDGERSDSEEYSDEDIKPKIKRTKSNDVVEGRTVFLKNVPFLSTEDELEEAVKKFGPICYAKICIDPMTEHSKGTAFVKFNTKQSADACLSAGTEFVLNGAILDPHPALPKAELTKKQNQPKNPSDSRNLYLLKEGVVTAGSKAAEGVSAADMGKRLQIERWKRQIIKDLGKFVSRIRIVIHNLPPYYDDKKVSVLLKKYAPKNARIKQVRVMRDLKNLDNSGVGKSKCFAFASFDKHEDALATLRVLNNNPSVFKSQRRPIVSFSVESRKALKVQEMRLEKSKQPKQTEETKPIIKIEKEEQRGKKEKGKKRLSDKEISTSFVEKSDNVEKDPFTGSFATPGSKKFINNLSLKRQALLHRKQLKKEKTKAKIKNKKLPRKIRKSIKMENMTRQKNPNKDDQTFTKLVDKYRTQLTSSMQKKKWFE